MLDGMTTLRSLKTFSLNGDFHDHVRKIFLRGSGRSISRPMSTHEAL